MRILFTGGGTGGHIFPLVAIARELKKINNEIEIAFIGPDKFSESILKKEGLKINGILSGKIRRYFSPLLFIDLFKMPVGLLQAYWHIFWFMPDIVFSKGGYGSAIAVFISWLFRIPIIIHESDSVPGLVNQLFSKISKKNFVSFEQSAAFFPAEKTSVVGNPIRLELFNQNSKNIPETLGIRTKKPVIFFMGGSQGAEQINTLLLVALADFIKKYEVLHQCGTKHFKKIKKFTDIKLKSNTDKKSYHPYSVLGENELACAYTASSIIVSRAGSGSIFEIAASGKPSILIPYNFSAGNHQEKNAHEYAKTGASIVLEGTNLTPHMLIGEIERILNNPERNKSMSRAARQFAKPEAGQRIAEEIIKLAI